MCDSIQEQPTLLQASKACSYGILIVTSACGGWYLSSLLSRASSPYAYPVLAYVAAYVVCGYLHMHRNDV